MKIRLLFANDQQKDFWQDLRTPEHRRTLEQKRDNTVLQRDWTHADSHKKIARSKTHFQPHRMADDRI